jgi:RNA polymerase sigma-70 factor (ECF subfamily)
MDVAALYDRHEREVLAFFSSRTRDGHVAAELCAETFAEVVNQVRRGAQVREPRGWLYAIARSKLADYERRGAVDRRARRKAGVGRLEVTDAAIERIDALGADPVLASALETLGDAERDAVLARVVADDSYAQIATRQGVSEPVVRKRVSRALARLRRAMEETP